MSDFAAWLAKLDEGIGRTELIDRIAVLEKLKSAASAAQIRATAAYDLSQRKAQSEAGVRAERIGEGISGEIGRARQESPNAGSRHLGAANALVKEMPHTLAALTSGVLSEWRASILVKETDCLDTEDRSKVDEVIAGDPKTLEGLGNKRLTAMAKQEAYRCDPYSVVNRAAKAASERTVTCRPAPDTMTYVTGLLPVAQGVAVQASLRRAADHLRSFGDGRTRGQIMADTLVDRITRPDHDQDGEPGVAGGADIEIQLVMTDRALVAGDQEPAYLQGYGTVPADWARERLLNSGNDKPGVPDSSPDAVSDKSADPEAGPGVAESEVWVRRLYTAPGTGQLIGMDSNARIFPKGLRKLIIARDQTCRGQWCDAPIRHIDHVRSHGDGGKTTEANGAGLCERCNLAKEAGGYESRPVPGSRHTVETITPTGHVYRSTAPPLPGMNPRASERPRAKPPRRGEPPSTGRNRQNRSGHPARSHSAEDRGFD